jgi:hypothetical protein
MPCRLIFIDVSKIRSDVFQNVDNYYQPHGVTSVRLALLVTENEGGTTFRNIENYLQQRSIPGDLYLPSSRLSGFSTTNYESNKPHDFKARKESLLPAGIQEKHEGQGHLRWKHHGQRRSLTPVTPTSTDGPACTRNEMQQPSILTLHLSADALLLSPRGPAQQRNT